MSKKPENVELIVYCERCRRKCWDPNENYVPVSVAERSGRQMHIPLTVSADLTIERDRRNCSFQLVHECNKSIGKAKSSFGDKRLEAQRNTEWGPSNWKQNWASCPCKSKKK